jgi:hypothetical protein
MPVLEDQEYDDYNFLVSDVEAQDEVIIEFSPSDITRRIVRTTVSYNSQAGWHIRDSRGIMWALDKGDAPGQFILNLHGKHVQERIAQ